MSQEDGPPRLKTSADAPPELQRALHALRTGDEGSPHLSRVAGRLGRLLDAPPGGPAPASTFLRTARRKLLATRFVVGSFAIGVTAAWLSRSPPSEQPTPAQTVVLPDHERDAPAAASAGVVTAAPPRVLAHPDAAEPVVVLPKPPLEPRLPPAGTPATRVRGRRPHALTRAAPPTSALEPSEVDVAAGSVDTQLVQPAPSHVEAPPVAPPAATAQKQTEAELLFAARRQIRRDPRAALRLVDEHVARFPDGLLAPEREVLAIEALRQLGQTAAAARRLQLFRARYPDSLHLRRLDRQAE